MKDRWNWKLNPAVFDQINSQLEPLEIDLFAFRMTTQLLMFYSWRPDPLAVGTDAFLQHWEGLCYANPGPMDSDTLSIIRGKESEGQCGPSSTSMEDTGLVPCTPIALNRASDHSTDGEFHDNPGQPNPSTIQGQRDPVGRVAQDRKPIRGKLQSSSWHHGIHSHNQLTTHSSESGNAGVINPNVIPFMAL